MGNTVSSSSARQNNEPKKVQDSSRHSVGIELIPTTNNADHNDINTEALTPKRTMLRDDSQPGSYQLDETSTAQVLVYENTPKIAITGPSKEIADTNSTLNTNRSKNSPAPVLCENYNVQKFDDTSINMLKQDSDVNNSIDNIKSKPDFTEKKTNGYKNSPAPVLIRNSNVENLDDNDRSLVQQSPDVFIPIMNGMSNPQIIGEYTKEPKNCPAPVSKEKFDARKMHNTEEMSVQKKSILFNSIMNPLPKHNNTGINTNGINNSPAPVQKGAVDVIKFDNTKEILGQHYSNEQHPNESLLSKSTTTKENNINSDDCPAPISNNNFNLEKANDMEECSRRKKVNANESNARKFSIEDMNEVLERSKKLNANKKKKNKVFNGESEESDENELVILSENEGKLSNSNFLRNQHGIKGLNIREDKNKVPERSKELNLNKTKKIKMFDGENEESDENELVVLSENEEKLINLNFTRNQHGIKGSSNKEESNKVSERSRELNSNKTKKNKVFDKGNEESDENELVVLSGNEGKLSDSNCLQNQNWMKDSTNVNTRIALASRNE